MSVEIILIGVTVICGLGVLIYRWCIPWGDDGDKRWEKLEKTWQAERKEAEREEAECLTAEAERARDEEQDK